MPPNLTQHSPLFNEVILSAKEGDIIDLPTKIVQHFRNEFEQKTKKAPWNKAVNATSFLAPLFAVNIYGFTPPKSLSGIFGTVALGLATAVATSYMAYQGNKFLINREKEKTDRKIQDYLGALTQDADSRAQYNYVQGLSSRIKADGYINLHELGKLVNISGHQFGNADHRLKKTVASVKDWAADNDANTATAQHRTENNFIKRDAPPISTSPLKARVHYPNAFRLVTLNLRHNTERKMETTYEGILSGLKNFTHVMFGDPKADDYLAPYSSTHTIPFIECDFQIRKIIQDKKGYNMQQALPALNPREYNK